MESHPWPWHPHCCPCGSGVVGLLGDWWWWENPAGVPQGRAWQPGPLPFPQPSRDDQEGSVWAGGVSGALAATHQLMFWAGARTVAKLISRKQDVYQASR